MDCIYYREVQKRNLIGDLYMQGYCIGTRECDDCYCDGDKTRCTFYPSPYKKALEERRVTMTKSEAEEKFNIKIVEDEER